MDGYVIQSLGMKGRSVKVMTCTDCIHKNRCPVRSRNYPCTDFKLKVKEKQNGIHNQNERYNRLGKRNKVD